MLLQLLLWCRGIVGLARSRCRYTALVVCLDRPARPHVRQEMMAKNTATMPCCASVSNDVVGMGEGKTYIDNSLEYRGDSVHNGHDARANGPEDVLDLVEEVSVCAGGRQGASGSGLTQLRTAPILTAECLKRLM